MSKLKVSLAVFALLTVALIASKAEEGTSVWRHGPSTGTSVAIPATNSAVLYGVSFSTFDAVAMPAYITFWSTNTVTGNPTGSARLWECPISTGTGEGNYMIPPMPIRAGSGLVYRASDSDAVFTIHYQERR